MNAHVSSSSVRTWIRNAGLGRVAYYGWHLPLGKLRESRAAGGPLEQWRDRRGRAGMTAAARRLPVPREQDRIVPLHLLSGRRFWDQTAFCLWSFAMAGRVTLAPVIYDDGSLTEDHRRPLERLFPRARFVSQQEAIARLDQFLPRSRFPVLRERWERYPNIRKLIDPHLGGEGWKLVIDSDLLFFHPPSFLLNWLTAPSGPLHAIDIETCYGYSRPLLNSLANARVADLVNVGLCGLNSSELDWSRLESSCRTLIAAEGTSYFLEQALVALLVAGRTCSIAPPADYVTLPQGDEAEACRAVMHHYVAGSKRHYFRTNWCTCIERATR